MRTTLAVGCFYMRGASGRGLHDRSTASRGMKLTRDPKSALTAPESHGRPANPVLLQGCFGPIRTDVS